MVTLALKAGFDELARHDHLTRTQALLIELDIQKKYSTLPGFQSDLAGKVQQFGALGIQSAYQQACALFAYFSTGVDVGELNAGLSPQANVLRCIQMALNQGVVPGAFAHIHRVFAGLGAFDQVWLGEGIEPNCLDLLSGELDTPPLLQLDCLQGGPVGQSHLDGLSRAGTFFRAQSGFQHAISDSHPLPALLSELCQRVLPSDHWIVSPVPVVEHCEVGTANTYGFQPTRQLQIADVRRAELNFTQRHFDPSPAAAQALELNWQQCEFTSDAHIRLASPLIQGNLDFSAGWKTLPAGYVFQIDGGLRVEIPTQALQWEACLVHEEVLVNLNIQLKQDAVADWWLNEVLPVGQLPIEAPLLVREQDFPLHASIHSVVGVGKPILNDLTLLAGHIHLKLLVQVNPETRELDLLLTLSHSALRCAWLSVDPLHGWCRGEWALAPELLVEQWNLRRG